jgi:hypothetical protein
MREYAREKSLAKDNPFMSLWLSGVNPMLGAAQS